MGVRGCRCNGFEKSGAVIRQLSVHRKPHREYFQ